MKKVVLSILTLLLCFFILNCKNDTDDPDPELAKWAGTWNPVHGYFDDPGLSSHFQAQYDALTDEQKTAFGVTSFEDLIPFARVIARTDFGSFVIQGDTIAFYDQQQTQKNLQGMLPKQ